MANGNPWYSAVEQSLPTYIPMPMDQLMQASSVIQQRGEQNLAGVEGMAQGLASIEARLPGHRDYVTNLKTSFDREAEDLLNKYNNNVADPQFSRDFARLRNKYTNDPNLRTILMANEADKRNTELGAKLAAEGKLFVNPRAMGIDDQGRIINDVGQVRGVNTLQDWEDRLKLAHQSMINDGRGWKTNEANLAEANSQIRQAIESGSPEVSELVSAYMTQGMSQQQAAQKVMSDYQRLSGQFAIKRDRDYGYDNLQISQARLNFEKAKEVAKQNRAGALVALNSPIEVRNLNEGLIEEVDKLIKFGTKGANKTTEIVEDTPENRAKYKDYKHHIENKNSKFANYSGKLEVPSEEYYNSNIDFINSAREEISHILEAKGINPTTATNEVVLNNYKEYLKADNNAPTFWTSPVKEIRDNITSQYIGQYGENLHDAVVVDKKGKHSRVAEGKIDLTDLKGFDFSGITTSPIRGKDFDLGNGALKATAINKEGEIVTIYKPLPPMLQQSIGVSSAVDRAITSGLTNDQLKNNPEYRGLNINGRYIPNIVPQKKGGRVSFYEVDNSGNIIGDEFNPQQIQQILNSEKAMISEYFSLHQNTD